MFVDFMKKKYFFFLKFSVKKSDINKLVWKFKIGKYNYKFKLIKSILNNEL